MSYLKPRKTRFSLAAGTVRSKVGFSGRDSHPREHLRRVSSDLIHYIIILPSQASWRNLTP